MRRVFRYCLVILFLLGLTMVYQYYWSGPTSGLFKRQVMSLAEIQQNGLRPTPYPKTVWFEIVPDALTTLGKRLGLGGWTDLGHVACATGCVEQEVRWTDGFQTVDLAVDSFSVDQQTLPLAGPRWMRLEIWGKVRHAAARLNQGLPEPGQRWQACGLLRRDDPYEWLEIHPRDATDLTALGSCAD